MNYYSIPLGGSDVNAVGPMRRLTPGREIKDHLAFYPDRVDAIEERPAT